MSCWNTENRFRFRVEDAPKRQVERPPFIVTTLDSRKHNPQSKQIFHIHRINAKVRIANSIDLHPLLVLKLGKKIITKKVSYEIQIYSIVAAIT